MIGHRATCGSVSAYPLGCRDSLADFDPMRVRSRFPGYGGARDDHQMAFDRQLDRVREDASIPGSADEASQC